MEKGKYSRYLIKNEKLEGVYDLGFLKKFSLYTVLTTNLRLIIIKKFPKNLIELGYKDIEVVEYYTNVEWIKSFYAALFIILEVIFFINRDLVLKQLAGFLPPLEPILYAWNFFGLNAGSFIIAMALLILSLYFLGLFIISLFGRLRILIYEQTPIEIVTKLTPELEEMMKYIETQKRRYLKSTRGSIEEADH